LYNLGGSPNRRVESLREGLANLACKLCRFLVHVRSWLLSWSSGHIAAGCDMVVLCWPWWYYSLVGGSSTVLCNAMSIVAFVIVSWFPLLFGLFVLIVRFPFLQALFGSEGTVCNDHPSICPLVALGICEHWMSHSFIFLA